MASARRTSAMASGTTAFTMSSAESSKAAILLGRLVGFVFDRRLDEAAVLPCDVTGAAMVARAVLGTAPGGLGREVENAEARDLPRGVGARLKMRALLPHRHRLPPALLLVVHLPSSDPIPTTGKRRFDTSRLARTESRRNVATATLGLECLLPGLDVGEDPVQGLERSVVDRLALRLRAVREHGDRIVAHARRACGAFHADIREDTRHDK